MLKRFQVVPPTLPRSGLEASARTLGLKATFPKSVPPKQTANPRSWTTRAAVESWVTLESPFNRSAHGSPCCAWANRFMQVTFHPNVGLGSVYAQGLRSSSRRLGASGFEGPIAC